MKASSEIRKDEVKTALFLGQRSGDREALGVAATGNLKVIVAFQRQRAR